MAMAYDPLSDQLVMFGGFSDIDVTYFGDTWTWDGTNWTEQHPDESPPAGYGPSMVYDVATDQVLLYGGTDDRGASNQTWSWDGANWTRLRPATTPPSGYGSVLVYDAGLEEVVLLPGRLGNPETTWAWNGSNWIKLHPDTEPPLRAYSGDASETGSGVLVFGGGYQCGDLTCYRGDTWSWDGANWDRLHPARGPGPRSGSPAANDPALGIVLFGGHGLHGYLNDTWTWDGTDWTRASPSVHPRARSGAAMVFDDALSAVLLFGGHTYFDGSFREFADLWAFDGTTWTPLG
jgi:hypothetical protein